MKPLTEEDRLEKLESYARSQRKRAWLDLSPKQYSNVVVNYLTLCDGAIVGDQDGLTVYSKWIKSDNFASGADGWRILGDGTAEFNSVVVRGTIYATAGEVGGWTINADTITGGNATLHSTGYLSLGTGNGLVRVDAVDATYRLWVGHATAGSAPFRVTKAGALTASAATITGTITATSGAIGGWTVNADTITGGNATLHSSGYLNLGTGNDLVRVDAVDATYRLWVGHATAGSAPFRVTKGGELTTISGTVGGWTLSSTGLSAGSIGLNSEGVITVGTNNDIVFLSAANATYRLWIGHATAGSAPFRVTKAGALTATSATVTGTITASAGAIGGWTVNADNITGGAAVLHSSGYLSLGTGNDLVRVDAADATYRLWIGHATAGSAPFRVTKGGALTATSATVTGTITASAGAIGGWTVNADNITGGAAVLHSSGYLSLGTGNDLVRVDAADATYRLWIGHATAGSAPFRVTKGGALTATSATVTGTITASAGAIGGWTVNADNITGGAAVLHSSGYLSLGTGNDLVRVDAANATYRLWIGNASAGSAPFRVTKGGGVTAADANITGTIDANAGHIGTLDIDGVLTVGSAPCIQLDGPNKRIESTNFASGVSGFRIDHTGEAEFNNVIIRGELHTAVFVHDQVHAQSGQLLVAPSACKLAQDATTAQPTLLYTDESTGFFGGGDIVRMKDGVSDAWFRIVIDYGDGHYSCELMSGATGQDFAEGTAVVSYGASGEGCLLLDASSAHAPFLDIFTHAGAPWTTQTLKVRVGNLAGVTDADLSPSGYGLYTDNVFLKGKIISTSGTIGGWTLAATTLTGGDVTLYSSGEIHVGTGNDRVALSAQDATYRLWVGHGTAASAPFRVTKAGVVTASSGTVGGWTMGLSTLTGGNVELDKDGIILVGTGNDVAKLSSLDGVYRLWVGADIASDAPFRVTKAGALTATDATLTGEFHTSNLVIDDSGIALTAELDIFMTTTKTTTGTIFGVESRVSLEPASASVASVVGLQGLARTANGQNAGTLHGLRGRVEHAGAGTLASAAGNYVFVSNNAGTLTDAYGIYSYINQEGAGTMTSATGLMLVMAAPAGTIVNAFGLRIGTLPAGATVRRAINQEGANDESRFAGHITVAGGLHVGGYSDPGTDNLIVDGITTVASYFTAARGRFGSTGDPGSWELYVTGQAYVSDYVRADGGLTTCSTDPGPNRLYVGDYAKIMGGLHVGGTSDPGTDNLWVDGDCRFGSGVWIGATGTNPDDNDLHIDGSINKSTALGCRARRSTAQSLTNNTIGKLSWNTQVYDTDGGFAPTSSRLYAKHAGYYIAGGGFSGSASAGSSFRVGIWIKHNNATYLGNSEMTTVSGEYWGVGVATGMFYMAVNNYVEVCYYQHSGSSLNTAATASSNHTGNHGWLMRIA